MRRAFGDTLISIASVLVLLVALVVFDGRVREKALLLLSGKQASADLASVGERVNDLGRIVVQVARDQGMEHAPLMIFVLAATVLVLFMLRT